MHSSGGQGVMEHLLPRPAAGAISISWVQRPMHRCLTAAWCGCYRRGAECAPISSLCEAQGAVSASHFLSGMCMVSLPRSSAADLDEAPLRTFDKGLTILEGLAEIGRQGTTTVELG